MKQRKKTGNAGFTLIELIMVIVILGILAAVAVPKYFNLQDDAKVAAEMGVAGGVRSGIGIIHGSLITKYASTDTSNNGNVTAVLQEVTGNNNITYEWDDDLDGWLEVLEENGHYTANSTLLFGLVMNDPLAGGSDGGSDGWVKTNFSDNVGSNYTGPASDAGSGVADEGTEGRPNKGNHWEYTEVDDDAVANNPDDGRFALVDN